MYLLFRYKDWEPERYKILKSGSKRIVKQFMYKQIEDMRKENSDMFGGGGYV